MLRANNAGFDKQVGVLCLLDALLPGLAAAMTGVFTESSAAGSATPSEIVTACRGTVKEMENDPTRSLLHSFAEKLETAESESEAEAERLLLAGWLPKEIADALDRIALNWDARADEPGSATDH